MDIALFPVTRQNFAAVMATRVAPGQEDFVASNAHSVAHAYVESALIPLAISAGGVVIGFAMFVWDDARGRWWITNFMIAAEHQGRGYGTAALRGLVDLMTERHGCREIFLSYSPGNAVAERLYARAGFVPTGEVNEGEIVARLDVG